MTKKQSRRSTCLTRWLLKSNPNGTGKSRKGSRPTSSSSAEVLGDLIQDGRLVKNVCKPRTSSQPPSQRQLEAGGGVVDSPKAKAVLKADLIAELKWKLNWVADTAGVLRPPYKANEQEHNEISRCVRVGEDPLHAQLAPYTRHLTECVACKDNHDQRLVPSGFNPILIVWLAQKTM